MNITTNNQSRELVSLADIPVSAQSHFDYIEGDDQFTERLFQYRGAWYDTHEFVRIVKRSDVRTLGFGHTCDDDSPLLAWHGIQTNTYFSGVVVRYVDAGERIIVGRIYA